MDSKDFQNGIIIGLTSSLAKNSNKSLDYTVTFISEGEPYEIIQVKKDNKINAPVTEPISESGTFAGWQVDGETATFPYPPEGNTVFNALFGTIADTVYTYYGINKEEYPYLAIQYRDSEYIHVVFAKTIEISKYQITYRDCMWGASSYTDFSDFDDIESAVQFAESKVPTLKTYTAWGTDIKSDLTRLIQYINFDHGEYVGTDYNI